MAEKDSIRYQKEKEEYEAKGYFVITKNGQSSKDAQQEVFEKAAVIKPKRVVSSYQFFVRERARSRSVKSTKSKFKRGEFIQVIAKEWRELPS